MTQCISLVLVLLLSLYGCAHLFERAAYALLRPRDPCVRFYVALKGHTEDIEQQIRFAQQLSRQLSIRLMIDEEGMDEEGKRMVYRLLDGGVGEIQHRVNEEITCIPNEGCV